MPRARTALVALALLLCIPAAAHAQQTNAPPGNSAIDEYLETVPGAAGNTPPRQRSDGGVGGVSAAERARLERLGPDGKTLADAVDATSPPSGGASKPKISAEGRSPLTELPGAFVGSGSGMGFVLPAILIAALLAALAAVLMRRRTQS